MEIGIITASPNKIGLTNSCAEIVKKVWEDTCKVEILCLNQYDIKRCEACGERGWGQCLTKHTCQIEDDFNKLQEIIGKKDILVIVSPVYFYEMSEVAKTFFDRLKRCQSFDEKSKLKGKDLLCIAAAGGSGDGTENCLHSMKILAKFLHMNVIGQIGVTKANWEQQKKVIEEVAKNFKNKE